MSKVYFVSVDCNKWEQLQSTNLRKVRAKASEMYPQGIYGSIYIGTWEDGKVEKLLVRSTKVNDQRVHWKRCYRANDARAEIKMRVFGKVFWLSIAGHDRIALPSVNIESAKKIAARSSLLSPGARIDIYCKTKHDTEPKLVVVGDCVSLGKIKWRYSVLDNVIHIPE